MRAEKADPTTLIRIPSAHTIARFLTAGREQLSKSRSCDRERRRGSKALCFWVYAYPAFLRYAAHSWGGY